MALHVSRCDQCGQYDDHPKVHAYEGGTWHHDCLPADRRAELVASSEQAKAIVEACEGGKRGAKLLAHIQQIHREG
jgi:hypothetical protein